MPQSNREATGVLRKDYPKPCLLYKMLVEQRVTLGLESIPDDDMLMELWLCQVKIVYNAATPETRDHLDDLVSLDALNKIYEAKWNESTERGIVHSSLAAYKQIAELKLLEPTGSREFNFANLMVSLLKSRVIGKALLGDAADIQRLIKAKAILEEKGYAGAGLMTVQL